MSKSQEVIDYVKALRERKLQLEALAVQSSPVFPAVDEQAMRTKIATLQDRQARLRQAYQGVRSSETESLLLSRVLVSGKQVSVEMAELREGLSSRHPAPSVWVLESQVEALELDILRFELELEERGTTSLLDKLMGAAEPALAVKPEPLTVGTMIDDRYRVDRLMAQSERGAVYAVSDQNTPQQWVVKEVWGEQGLLNPEQIERWTLQARHLSGMRHPNLPRVVDAMSEQGRCFLIVDALTGVRLDEVLSATGRMPAERGLPLCLQLAEVVRYLHQQSPPFLISDLSSRRILVEASGQIKVMSSDFAHRVDTLQGDPSARLEQDRRDLVKLMVEVLDESEVMALSEPLRALLLGGLEGRHIELDLLVQLLGDEIRSLRKEESGVREAVTTDQSRTGPGPSNEARVRARGSKLSIFYRGVKKVVEKIGTST